jgi:hypothetical protein
MQPVNTYNVFYALAKKEPHGLRRLKDILERFSIFGFVIYDPLYHLEFKNELEEYHEQFDSISGRNFLFFSVVHSESGNFSEYKKRPYYKELAKLEPQRGIVNPVNAKAESSAAYTLAAHLEIDIKYLPVIVISKDLEFGHKEVIPVNKNNFGKILFEIGNIATRELKELKDEDFKNILVQKNILSEENFNISSNTVNLNNGIYDAIGCFQTKASAVNKNRAKIHINSLIKQLEAILDQNKNNKSIYEKTLIKLSSILATADIAIGNQEIQHPISSSKNTKEKGYLTKNWQDDNTKIYLNAFYDISEKNYSFEDYSPIGIPLAKAIENEIILSYFNWIRKIKGIPMPEYYNIPFGKNKFLFSDRKDLNSYTNNPLELLPLGLGQTLSCMNKVLKNENSVPDFHTADEIKQLIKLFYKINNSRIKIAHGGKILNQNELTLLESTIDQIFNGSFGPKIGDLKKSLSSKI